MANINNSVLVPLYFKCADHSHSYTYAYNVKKYTSLTSQIDKVIDNLETINIPTVFHFLAPTGSFNKNAVSAQIHHIIGSLNDDFNNYSPNSNTMNGLKYKNIVTDVFISNTPKQNTYLSEPFLSLVPIRPSSITFSLAQIYYHPIASPLNLASYNDLTQVELEEQAIKQYLNMHSAQAIDPERVMNIWVVDMINTSILGFSNFPWETIDPFHGIILSRQVVCPDFAQDFYDHFKAITHHVGHYLGIIHTFNDPNLPISILGADTKTAGPIYDPTDVSVNQKLFTDPAFNPLFMNFMDFTFDKYVSNFIPDQIKRMRQTIIAFRPLLGTPITLPDPPIITPITSTIFATHLNRCSSSNHQPNQSAVLATAFNPEDKGWSGSTQTILGLNRPNITVPDFADDHFVESEIRSQRRAPIRPCNRYDPKSLPRKISREDGWGCTPPKVGSSRIIRRGRAVCNDESESSSESCPNSDPTKRSHKGIVVTPVDRSEEDPIIRHKSLNKNVPSRIKQNRTKSNHSDYDDPDIPVLNPVSRSDRQSPMRSDPIRHTENLVPRLEPVNDTYLTSVPKSDPVVTATPIIINPQITAVQSTSIPLNQPIISSLPVVQPIISSVLPSEVVVSSLRLDDLDSLEEEHIPRMNPSEPILQSIHSSEVNSFEECSEQNESHRPTLEPINPIRSDSESESSQYNLHRPVPTLSPIISPKNVNKEEVRDSVRPTLFAVNEPIRSDPNPPFTKPVIRRHALQPPVRDLNTPPVISSGSAYIYNKLGQRSHHVLQPGQLPRSAGAINAPSRRFMGNY
jgi:hypothetical protein